jgi:hypothetical protein
MSWKKMLFDDVMMALHSLEAQDCIMKEVLLRYAQQSCQQASQVAR